MSMVDGQCPVGWTFYYAGGMCYKFFQGDRTYDEAYYLCKEQGGDLASIHSDDEALAIIKYWKELKRGDMEDGLWFGLVAYSKFLNS